MTSHLQSSALTASRLTILLCLSVSCFSAIALPAQAQTAAGSELTAFAIPAGPLGTALTRFGLQANLQILYPADLVRDRQSAGVSGSLTRDQALTRLLAGTGIGYRFGEAGSIILYALPAASEGATTLQPLVIEGSARRDATEGYIARQSTAGTKTDTPVIEVPQSISVVTRDQMDAQNAQSLSQALRYTAGVAAEPLGSDNRNDYITVRGFNLSDGGFYLDGLRNSNNGYSLWSTETYGLERVEVVKGPAAALFGQGSPGGVVNQVSKRPTSDTLREVELQGGSYAFKQAAFDFGGALDTNKLWSFRLTGLAKDSDTQIDFVEEQRLYIAPALAFRPNEDTSVTILSSLQRDRFGSVFQYLPANGTVAGNPNGQIPRDRFAGDTDFDGYDRDQYTIGYLFEHKLADSWTVRQNLRYRHMDLDYRTVYAWDWDVGGVGTDVLRSALTSKTTLDAIALDNQAQADFETGPLTHKAIFGLDYQWRKVSAFNRIGDLPGSFDLYDPDYNAALPTTWFTFRDQNLRGDQIGIYAQDQIKLQDKWVLTVGARQDWAQTIIESAISGTDRQIDAKPTFRAGLTYLSDTGLAPYLSFSQSFEPADYIGKDAYGVPLAPTTGEQYEVGMKYKPTGFESFITLSAFQIIQNNVLTPYGGPDPLLVDEVVQTGRIRSRGIEIEGVASLSDSLNLVAAYSYNRVAIMQSNAGDVGNRPYNVPEHLASVWLDYKIDQGTFDGLRLGGGLRYVGATFGDNANSIHVPAYTLADVMAGYDFGARDPDLLGATLSLNVSNLFDKVYAACNSSDFRCNYGEPRKITAALKYKW